MEIKTSVGEALRLGGVLFEVVPSLREIVECIYHLW